MQVLGAAGMFLSYFFFLKAGAQGYVLKFSAHELVNVVEALLLGRTFLPSDLGRQPGVV